jgi:multidrug efflux pump subunit AcrB
VRAGERYRSDPAALGLVFVPSAQGTPIRLPEVADVAETMGHASIERLSRQRQATLYANVTPGTSEASVIAALVTLLATPVVYTGFDDLSRSSTIARLRRAIGWPGRRLARALGARRTARR